MLLKKGQQCTTGKERFRPHQSKDLNPTMPTIRKKEEKWKTVHDKKGASN